MNVLFFRYSLSFLLLISSAQLCFSQLSSPLVIRMSDTGMITEVQFSMDQGAGSIWFSLTEKGNIGIMQSGDSRATYASPSEGSGIKGNISAIDDMEIHYYRTNIRGEKAGSIGMVGTTEVVYFDRLEEQGKSLKVKKIDDLEIDYHNNFYGQQITGKIAKIGNIEFEYGLTPDSNRTPRIKKIGNLVFSYVLGFQGDGSNNKVLEITGNEPNVHIQVMHW